MKKILTTIITLIVIFAIGNEVYKQINKQEVPGKTKRLPCLAKVTSFERAYGNEDIKKAQIKLQRGNYILKYGIDKATFMESTLFENLDLKEIEEYTNKELHKNIKEQTITNEHITIEYKIYENDKKDPKKKSDNCKLFRGYVVFKIINNKKKTVYQAQIDFLDPKGADIKQTISCAIKAFTTYNKKGK